MTNRDNVDTAWGEILTTTISGSEWQKRVTYGYKGKPYNWQNTAYGRAKTLLDQVTNTPIIEPPSTLVIPKPTYKFTLKPNYYASQDGPEANYQVCWIGRNDSGGDSLARSGSYHIDRDASDEFAAVLMYRPLAPAPNRPEAGNWGRAWNFHNSPKERGGAGWNLPNTPPARSPGNSAMALDRYDGYWSFNLDDNETSGGQKRYQLAPVELDKRVTIGLKCVLGRVDGTTARPGSVKVSIDDKYVLDLPRCNTVWLFRLLDGTTFAQRYMEMWVGHYTQNLKTGYTISAELAWPFVGKTPTEALANKVGGEGGPWALSNIPIPGKDHSAGPATCVTLPSWTSADLVLPPGW